MKTKKKEKIIESSIESFTVNGAIEKVKSGAMTNIILISHMSYLTTEEKLYLAYFWGTREGKSTILDFSDMNKYYYPISLQ